LGQAVALIRSVYPRDLEDLLPDGVYRLVHEVAERIADGRVGVPHDLQARLPKLYEATNFDIGTRGTTQAGQGYFSELSNPENKKKAFGYWREKFNENDIDELIKDQNVLANFDAYCKEIVTLGTANRRMFGERFPHPRDLSTNALFQLALEICSRIERRQIAVPADLRDRYPDAYEVDTTLDGSIPR
jgi:hypothetical protein